MNNINKKIFPEPIEKDYTKIKYDNEGLWSLTTYNLADLISETILEIVKDPDKKIIDTSCGCGGNLISFSKYFNNITAIELNFNRFTFVKNNLSLYSNKKIEIINGDCLNYIYKYDYDIYFFDPPWGGPNYKNKQNIDLYLSNKSLNVIIEKLSKNKLIVIKVPYNYNIKLIKNKYEIINKLTLGNMNILFFYT